MGYGALGARGARTRGERREARGERRLACQRVAYCTTSWYRLSRDLKRFNIQFLIYVFSIFEVGRPALRLDSSLSSWRGCFLGEGCRKPSAPIRANTVPRCCEVMSTQPAGICSFWGGHDQRGAGGLGAFRCVILALDDQLLPLLVSNLSVGITTSRISNQLFSGLPALRAARLETAKLHDMTLENRAIVVAGNWY